jgi:serine/threonine protein kinase
MTAAAHNPKVQSATHGTRELLPGDVLDAKYRLDAVVGAGAMGQVWRAHNIMLDLAVAIKVVTPSAHGREAVDRLLTEARFEAQLRHPNIVKVIDVGRDQEVAYVVMELLEGCTLADLMDEGPLPAALAVRLVLPLLDGLCAAHKKGIVHRDIKPENVFIARTAGGRVCPKLLDFGIARSDTVATRNPKKARVVMGTPGYMSPEQAWGDDSVDHRADIWALGVVLYEAICGESAFACTDYVGFLRALEERELTPLAGEGIAELWNVIRRATTKALADRYQTSVEFAQALAGFLRDRGVFEDLSGDSLPEHWATPGSLIYRAWRRSNPRMSMLQIPALRVQSRIVAPAHKAAVQKPAAKDAMDAMDAMDAAKARKQAPRTPHAAPRKARSGRAWQAVSLVLGGILGITISLARTSHNKPHLEPRPPIAHAMAAEEGVDTHAGDPLLPPPSAALPEAPQTDAADAQPFAKKGKRNAAKKASTGRQTPKDETRDGSTPRSKTRRAYANNNRPWPGAEDRVALQREAAELGLKSPR